MVCLAASGGRGPPSWSSAPTVHTIAAWCIVCTLCGVLYVASSKGTVGHPATLKAGLSEACRDSSTARRAVLACFEDSKLDFHIVLSVQVALLPGNLQIFICPIVSVATCPRTLN
jgi:hypothetical protein